jgi:hypothetical protein
MTLPRPCTGATPRVSSSGAAFNSPRSADGPTNPRAIHCAADADDVAVADPCPRSTDPCSRSGGDQAGGGGFGAGRLVVSTDPKPGTYRSKERGRGVLLGAAARRGRHDRRDPRERQRDRAGHRHDRADRQGVHLVALRAVGADRGASH